MLFDEFKPVVEIVLNNWTALQLAVEHGMGSPGGKETAQLMAVYVTRYCVENGIVDRDDLTEVLEDLMDEEFETVCHDNSPKEVASLLVKLICFLRENRREEMMQEINNMPKCELWLCKAYNTPSLTIHGNPNDDTTSESEEDEEASPSTNGFTHSVNIAVNGCANSSNLDIDSHSVPMEDDTAPMEEDSDPGWTVVKGRRKK